MWYLINPKFYEDEKKSVLRMYPSLSYTIDNGIVKLSGELEFYASYNNQEILDSYSVIIVFPDNYPQTAPESFESGNKIPDTYHKNPDFSLCIAPPLELIRKFSSNPCIINYINNLLIPYLYRFSFIYKFGHAPFGEYSHGVLGLIEFYFELLEINSISTLGTMILLVLENNYRGHSPCPCGSSKRLRNCHGLKLKMISKLPVERLQLDLINISNFLEKKLKV